MFSVNTCSRRMFLRASYSYRISLVAKSHFTNRTSFSYRQAQYVSSSLSKHTANPTTSLKRASLGIRTTASSSVGASEATPLHVSKEQLCLHALNCAVPMVGFGFMDNVVMIVAGNTIDAHIGATFAMSTLTAAALGQICSDVSGVCFGGTLEALAKKMGMPSSGLSAKQRELKIVKRIGTSSAAFGVMLGCILGMFSLFFIDLDCADRRKRQAELGTLFSVLATDSLESLGVQKCTLWLLSEDGKFLYSRARQQETYSEAELKKVFQIYDINDDVCFHHEF